MPILTKEQKLERLKKIPNRTPTIYRKLVCSNFDGNNNKWWSAKLWEPEDVILIEYARIGQTCSVPIVLIGGEDYHKGYGKGKVNEKVNSKLNEKDAESHYEELKLAEEKIVSTYDDVTDPKLQARLQKIFAAANESISKTLVGRVDELSLDQIAEAKATLMILSEFAKTHKDEKDIPLSQDIHFVSSVLRSWAQKYYNLIPTDLGRKIDPIQVTINLATNAADEEDRLQQLKAALEGSKIQKSGGTILDQLGSHMKRLESTDEGFKQVKTFISTTSSTNLRNLEVYEIIIHKNKSEYDAEQRGATKTQFLCHGTKKMYVRHILRSGLIVPESGYSRLFGYGIYFGDSADKSLSYTDGNENYLFLNEVKVGRQHVARYGNNWRARDLPEGVDSLYAPGHTPIQGAYNGALRNSEYVVYYASQQTAKFLAIF